MKYAVIIPDGMADYPLDVLGGKTPLEAARTPNMDRLASEGMIGLTRNVPEGMPPGSDVAIMSVLGYDPAVYHTGRAPLEAPDIGVELASGEVAFRMNLVTLADGVMADYSAGHVSTEEAKTLVEALQDRLGEEPFRLHPGVSYRHLAVSRDMDLLRVACTPPHDITGEPFEDHLPRGDKAWLLVDVMERAAEILEKHEVNAVRRDLGENPANGVWFWGQGTRPDLPSFEETRGLRGAMISAVALLRSLALYAGLDRIDVPGATGYLDTNYRGKGEYALGALDDHDLVVVHVEAPDEAGHNRNVKAKVEAIERIDEEVVGVLARGLEGSEARMMVLADHPTPIIRGTHTAEAVPFLLWGTGIPSGGAAGFGEGSCRAAGKVVSPGHRLMDLFLS